MWTLRSVSVDGLRLGAKLKSAKAAEGKRRTTKDENFGSEEVQISNVFSLNAWSEAGTDECMYTTETEEKKGMLTLCSSAGACKERASSKDWVRFI